MFATFAAHGADDLPLGPDLPDREHAARLSSYVTYVIPLRYYANILRGIFLRAPASACSGRRRWCCSGMGVGILTAGLAAVPEEPGLSPPARSAGRSGPGPSPEEPPGKPAALTARRRPCCIARMRHLVLPRTARIASFLSITLFLAGAGGPGSPHSRARSRRRRPPRRRPPTPEPSPEAADSPRASARSLIELTARKGDFKGAARYLQLPAGEEAQGPELARRLRASSGATSTSTSTPSHPSSRATSRTACPRASTRSATCPTERGAGPFFIVRRTTARLAWAYPAAVSRIDAIVDASRSIGARLDAGALQRQPGRRPHVVAVAGLPVLFVWASFSGGFLGVVTSWPSSTSSTAHPDQWDERLLRRHRPRSPFLGGSRRCRSSALARARRPPLIASRFSAATTLAVFSALSRSVDVWCPFPDGKASAADALRPVAPLHDPQPRQAARRRRRGSRHPRRLRLPRQRPPRRVGVGGLALASAPRRRSRPLRLDLPRRRPALPRGRLREDRG